MNVFGNECTSGRLYTGQQQSISDCESVTWQSLTTRSVSQSNEISWTMRASHTELYWHVCSSAYSTCHLCPKLLYYHHPVLCVQRMAKWHSKATRRLTNRRTIASSIKSSHQLRQTGSFDVALNVIHFQPMLLLPNFNTRLTG